jgi:hypothetical protein
MGFHGGSLSDASPLLSRGSMVWSADNPKGCHACEGHYAAINRMGGEHTTDRQRDSACRKLKERTNRSLLSIPEYDPGSHSPWAPHPSSKRLMGTFRVRQARVEDTDEVADVLREAARWLEDRGSPLWRDDELRPDRLAAEVAAGDYFVGEGPHGIVATVRLQLEDTLFWPDSPPGEAAYMHRLAVRRNSAGGVVSCAMMQWAVDRTRVLRRQFLRLDCEANRLRLRAVYEQFGFRYHSNRQVGPYMVARYEFPVSRNA